MRVVIADTGPVHYLVLIQQIDILPQLFERVTIPSVVNRELTHAETPQVVRDYMNQPPQWLHVIEVSPDVNGMAIDSLDDGEKAVITLAASLKADLLLMDDRKGAKFARTQGFAVTGTLGLLDLAAKRGLIELPNALLRLTNTNFYCPKQILEALLDRYKNEHPQ